MRVLTKAACCAAVVLLAAAPARADQWDKLTFLTFSGPVQVPGVTLPAGTYTFKLADLNGNRHVVQIFDKEQKKIYTTLLAIPHQLAEPPNDPVVLFSERPAGMPQAIKAWFYPGQRTGNEFVYPKTQAIAIARATHQTVLATDDTLTDADRMKGAAIGRVDESGQMTETSGAAAAATTAKPDLQAPTGTAGRATTARATTAAASPRVMRSELPRTASDLPLFGLLSGFTLAAGLVIRRARRRLFDAA